MAPVYGTWDDVSFASVPANLTPETLLFADVEHGGYGAMSVQLLWEVDGQLFEYVDSCCSCDGVEWDAADGEPVEGSPVTWAALALRGVEPQPYDNAADLAFRALVKAKTGVL